MKAFLSLLLAAGFLLVDGAPASACSCAASSTPEQALANSTLVFSGSVVEVQWPFSWDVPVRRALESDYTARVTFRVHTVWKGQLRSELALTTPPYGPGCGYAFEKGKDYLVYAYGSVTDLGTDTCTRTRGLSAAGEDLAALGEGAAPTSGEPDQGVLTLRHLASQSSLICAGVVIAAIGLVFRRRRRSTV